MSYWGSTFNPHFNTGKVDTDKVCYLIMKTKTHDFYSGSEDVNRIIKADLSILISLKEKLFEYENGIFYEYQKTPLDVYKRERVKFLEKLQKNYLVLSPQYENIKSLISYVQNRKYTIAYYAGSFNPYHIGHENIAKQAESIADKVIIAQGYNRSKTKPPMPLEHPFRQTIQYDGLITDLFTEEENVNKILVRGLRNNFDVGDEDNLRNTIYDIKKIRIVYFFCDREFEHVSSSMIRSLYDFGEDVYGKYLINKNS